jgi:hypothetical protein
VKITINKYFDKNSMPEKKPLNIIEYKKWLKEKFNLDLSNMRYQAYYESVSNKILHDSLASPFWQSLIDNLHNFDDEYYDNTNFHLMMKLIPPPELMIKPYNSLILKSFKKNVINNKNWPNEPYGGWLFPDTWFNRANDIVRTSVEVKYLDGVEFLMNKMGELCAQFTCEFEPHLEAREDGYYAAHLYIYQNFLIPKLDFGTEIKKIAIEIQITTQLQEVIKNVLHKYYESKREQFPEKTKWQWDYKSDEFAANYLGHILHYLEGMIVEIRDRPITKD